MLLKLDNIGKIYNSNDLLVVGIRGVNLEFDLGEFVTIEGESGSGKSTLLNVIGANDTYEEGELWFNGMETSHYSEDEWEKYRENNIATVFQDFNIIENLTVLENVELALFRLDDPKERRKVALELIDKVGLTNQANQRGSKLSGGEKQRTVIARALAKDSPIILADEPTGNLDVKASREVARILKEVSRDKLVIVVTHNPEFFEQYATRRVRVFDGQISEDRVIEKPAPVSSDIDREPKATTRLQNFKNTMHIGVLNYKSRPKFTAMMTFALFVCAITLFMILSVFGSSMLKATDIPLDRVPLEGKVIISSGDDEITIEELDELAGKTNASYYLLNRQMAEFTLNIPKKNGVTRAYSITCLYDPMRYNLAKGKAHLIIPKSDSKDINRIKEIILGANVGIDEISVETVLDSSDAVLYMSHSDLTNNGKKILAVNSDMRFGSEDTTVYTFRVLDTLLSGEVNIVNSIYYDAIGKTVVLMARPDKVYTIVEADKMFDNNVRGIVVEMNEDDYNRMFAEQKVVSQSCLYYENDDIAREAMKALPAGYLGMLSTNRNYVQNVGEVFTNNVMYYIVLIAVSILFGMLIVVIFMRSVKIYQADFAVYKTLGISRKISSLSLYIEMALIFLPTLVLLPIVSLIATVVPGSHMTFISFGDYVFIELMMLFIVEMVAFSFNKSINSKSIRKSLKRGSK